MNGLPYYPRYARDFIDGTAGMPFELKGAYGIILDLIYMLGGNLPNDPHYLAGQLGMSVRKVNMIVPKLVEAGKIRIDDGIISNKRADNLLIISRSFSDKQSKNRSLPNKIKALPSPNDHHTDTDTDPSSEEDKSSSDAKGVETGFSKRVFEEGVALLERHDLTRKSARAQIGKWRHAHPDPALTEAFAAFEEAGATDPVSWITARLAPPPAAPSKERASTDAQVEFYAKMANGSGYVAPSAISAPMARLMLERGLVTEETLRSKGIAA